VGPGAAQLVQSGAVQLPVNVPSSAIDITWSVNGYYLGNFGGGGTIVPGSGEGVFATYTAPRCAPRSLVEISASVAINLQGQNVAWTIARARIRVIPKRWTIDLFYRVQTPCSTGFVFSVDFCRSHKLSTFVLRNRQVDSLTPGPDHSDERTERSAWCVSSPCDQPVLSTISQLNLTALTGTLIETDTLNPTFDLTVSADVPGDGARVNFTCGGVPAPPLPIVHNAKGAEVQHVRVRYSDLKNYANFSLNPFVREEVEVTLQPISCDLIAAPSVSSCN